VTKLPQMVGDMMSDVLNWRWDRGRMRYEATIASRDGEDGDHTILVQFTKIGGRWSKNLPDGTPAPYARARGCWTARVDNEDVVQGPPKYGREFESAEAAKDAAAREFVRRYGWRS